LSTKLFVNLGISTSPLDTIYKHHICAFNPSIKHSTEAIYTD